MHNINILILNAGPSLGIKSYGPRCLLKVSKQYSILDKQIQLLYSIFDSPNIAITAGFRIDKIKECLQNYPKINLIENERFETTNELYSINLTKDIKNNLLILPGNILFKKSIFKNFNYNKSQLWLSKQQKTEIGCTLDSNNIEYLMWGLSNYWLNIGYFIGKELNLLQRLASQDYTDKYFMYEGINYVIEKGGSIVGNFINDKIKIINKMADVR